MLTRVLTGHAAGSRYNYGGGGANYLCLPKDPDWDNFTDAVHAGRIAGVQYTFYRNNVFLKVTPAMFRYAIIQHLVQSVIWLDVQQSLWSQPKRSVRVDGTRSMAVISLQIIQVRGQLVGKEAVTCAGIEHQKSMMADTVKTKLSSTLLKSSVEHCHVNLYYRQRADLCHLLKVTNRLRPPGIIAYMIFKTAIMQRQLLLFYSRLNIPNSQLNLQSL